MRFSNINQIKMNNRKNNRIRGVDQIQLSITQCKVKINTRWLMISKRN